MGSALGYARTLSRYWFLESDFAESMHSFLAESDSASYFADGKEHVSKKQDDFKALAIRMSSNYEASSSYFADMTDSVGTLKLKLSGVVTENYSSYSSSGIALSELDYILDKVYAEAGEGVKQLSIQINSPGGVPKSLNTGKMIEKIASKIPTYAIIDTLGASAALALVGGSGIKRYATPTVTLGGVAAVARFSDYGRSRKTSGIDDFVLSSGERKIDTELRDDTGALSKESLANRQKELDLLGETFVNFIHGNAGLTDKQKAEIASGRYWIDSEAMKSGLIIKQMLVSEYHSLVYSEGSKARKK